MRNDEGHDTAQGHQPTPASCDLVKPGAADDPTVCMVRLAHWYLSVDHPIAVDTQCSQIPASTKNRADQQPPGQSLAALEQLAVGLQLQVGRTMVAIIAD